MSQIASWDFWIWMDQFGEMLYNHIFCYDSVIYKRNDAPSFHNGLTCCACHVNWCLSVYPKKKNIQETDEDTPTLHWMCFPRWNSALHHVQKVTPTLNAHGTQVAPYLFTIPVAHYNHYNIYNSSCTHSAGHMAHAPLLHIWENDEGRCWYWNMGSIDMG